MKKLLISTLLLASCTSSTWNRNHGDDVAFEEIFIELADLKQELSRQQLELQIVTETFGEQALKNNGDVKGRIASLEKKFSSLERSQQRTNADLKELTTYTEQTTHSMSQYKDQIQKMDREISKQKNQMLEVSKLKGTLNSISRAMHSNASSSSTYQVRSGDSLEKIARRNNVSIADLKEANSLKSDLIYIGQKLTIPSAK